MDTLAVLGASLDGLPFGITVWRAESEDPDDLTLVYANSQASREAGLDLAGHVGRSLASVTGASKAVPPPVPDAQLKELGLSAALRRTANVVPRYRYVDPEGAQREFRVHLVPVWERTVALVFERLDDARIERQPGHAARIYFEDVVRTLHEPLVVVDSMGQVEWANEVYGKFFGSSADAVVGSCLADVAPEHARAELNRILRRAANGETVYEPSVFVRHDGEERTCLVSARVLNSSDADQPLVLVALNDDTERRRNEALQHSLVEQLVRTRDEERRSLARELHDHVGQSLTAVSVHLKRIEGARDLAAAKDLVGGLSRQIDQLSLDLSALVNQMHPYRLEQLGLPAAVRELLQEFSRTHKVRSDCQFTGFDEAVRLEPEVGIGMFRIVQEALTNVARHSGAASVNVVIHRSEDTLRAVIEDDGRGFDPEAARARADGSAGFGLTTLQERAQLMHGTLTIESTPDHGTAVVVVVPLRQAES